MGPWSYFEPIKDSQKQKLLTRKAKAAVQGLQKQALGSALDGLTLSKDNEVFQQCLDQIENATTGNPRELHERLIRELPRCKPQMYVTLHLSCAHTPR
jgi:hypothetical protein